MRVSACRQLTEGPRVAFGNNPEPRAVLHEISMGAPHAEGSIIEECDLTIRVSHDREPGQHAACKQAPGLFMVAYLRRKEPAELNEIDDILKDDCVIHRA